MMIYDKKPGSAARAGLPQRPLKNTAQPDAPRRLIFLGTALLAALALLAATWNSAPAPDDPTATAAAETPSAESGSAPALKPAAAVPPATLFSAAREDVRPRALHKNNPPPVVPEGLPAVDPVVLESLRNILDSLPQAKTGRAAACIVCHSGPAPSRRDIGLAQAAEQNAQRVHDDPKIIEAAFFSILGELENEDELEFSKRVLERLGDTRFRATAQRLSATAKPPLRAALFKLIGSAADQDAADWLLTRVVNAGGDTDGDVIEALARYLRNRPDQVYTVARTLESNDNPARIKALLAALAACDLEAGVDLAARHLTSRDTDVVLLALNALQKLGLKGRPQPAALLSLIGGNDVPVAKQAVMTAAACKSLSAVPLLIARLKHSDESLRATALWALRQITGRELAGDPALWAAWWKQDGERAKTDIPLRLRELSDPAWQVRQEGLQALLPYSGLLDAAAAQAVRRCLKDPAALVRNAACFFVASARYPNAVCDVAACLRDADPSVQTAAKLCYQSLTGQPAPQNLAEFDEFKQSAKARLSR
jgi:HEAT repeat protein